MADETQVQESTAAEQAVAGASGQAEKKKKINRLTADELRAKIKVLEEKGMHHSVYYRHLLQRKQQLGVE